MIETVKIQADIEQPETLIGYLVNGNMSVPLAEGNRHYNEVQEWIGSETIIGTPASEDYQPEVGTPASEDYVPDSDPQIGTPPSEDWQPQTGTPASEDYEVIINVPEPAYTVQEIQDYQVNKISVESVELITQNIQNEIDYYNITNNIALASVHNAESYSRMMTYTHQPFCQQVWEWSVALWEHMRAWQETLVGLPTLQEVQAKIDELPFGG